MAEGNKNFNKFGQYAGMAFQLLIYLLIGYFIGSYIDLKLGNTTPYAVAGTCTLFLILALYVIVRDVLRIK